MASMGSSLQGRSHRRYFAPRQAAPSRSSRRRRKAALYSTASRKHPVNTTSPTCQYTQLAQSDQTKAAAVAVGGGPASGAGGVASAAGSGFASSASGGT